MMKFKPPTPRIKVKLTVITLFFPVTATIGMIGIYRLTASGLQLVRVLHGCQVH